MINRKLIRPSLAEMNSNVSKYPVSGRKRVPPEQTHAENFYYVKQMNNKTAMVAKLINGEELHGYIEWYDKDCIKFNRDDAPNLLLYKASILYLYKAEEIVAEPPQEQPQPKKRGRKPKAASTEKDSDK